MLALLYSALLVSSAAAEVVLPFGTSTRPTFLQHYRGFTKPAARKMGDQKVMVDWSPQDMAKEYQKTSPDSTHYIYLAYITSDITTAWYYRTAGPREEQQMDSEGRQGDGTNDVSYTTASELASWGPWSWKHIRGWYMVAPGKAQEWHRNQFYAGPRFSDEHPEK
ncbi:hypothetical protein MGG_11627 [Pyricularia oryzae 70-15]|uniref:Cholera enterotoxin subunit A2 n=4 Tax=Pyricularia TaxID=48558 RepID=G4NDL2_PYRO7|nr:uncharacterized protein MGG_11627 [Pyricularia oryzae 70-15]EHA49297.1 hypothetical protein MGG_11627 [Pyricularia oryzae 70-15]ELQ32444.1 hypothetical protein OOU_Y34scaffold01158g1 [Pyricularia oryzae Y34]